MAENGTSTGADLNLGDLGQIRNILMGQQMSAYEARFKALEEQLNSEAAANAKRLEELEKETRKSIEAMEKGSNASFERLEKMVEKKLDQLTKKLEDSSLRDKNRIGKLLSDMGKKLMEA